MRHLYNQAAEFGLLLPTWLLVASLATAITHFFGLWPSIVNTMFGG